MKKGIFLFAALICAALIIGISCNKSSSYTAPGGGGGTPPTGFATDSISLTGIHFVPAVDTVHVGATVKFKNNDGIAHTTTSDDGTTFNSGNMNAGVLFTFVPTTTGTFTYHCQYHQSMGMVGTLIVKP
jgi:plastocyanin